MCDAARVDAPNPDVRIDEAMKRAGLVWLRIDDRAASPRWHTWSDNRAYVLTGGIEQPPVEGIDRPSAAVEVTVATTDHAACALTWPATVRAVAPGSDEWQAAMPALRRERLNAPDGDGAPARWERECSLFALEPAGPPSNIAPA